MNLHFHLDNNQAIAAKTSKWQSDFTTEVTIAPSKFRHRDFADEKYLKRFVRNFHTESSTAMQGRVAKDQANLRQFRDPVATPEDVKSRKMSLVFQPLDKEEEMGTDHVKAYTTGVHRQWIDTNKAKRDERSLRNTFPELMQEYDPEPKLFVRNFRCLRPTDKFAELGLDRQLRNSPPKATTNSA